MTVRPLAPLLTLACLGVSSLILAGCGDSSSPTSPSTTDTTTTTTAADPTVAEHFTGTIGPNGSRFYSFEVAAYGTVNLTLQNVGGVTGVPDSVWVGLGVGVPDGTDCSTTTSSNVQAGGGPHVSTSLTAGTYCARVFDIGNLAAATPFAVLIDHP